MGRPEDIEDVAEAEILIERTDRMNRLSFLAGRTLAVALCAALVTLSSAPPAPAMLAPVSPAAQDGSPTAERNQDLESVRAFLERKMVRERLLQVGLSHEEATRRLNRLTDAQMRRVARTIDAQAPGGNAGGVVITVLVIGVLALLFVYLLERV